MGRRGPQVVDGYRSPLNAPERKGTEDAVRKAVGGDLGFLAVPTESTIGQPLDEAAGDPAFRFSSKIEQLQLTVREVHEPRLDGETGRVATITCHRVAFSEGIFETRDPRMAELVRKHPRFNITFFDADEVAEKSRRAYAQDVLERVDMLPEDVKEQLRVRLGAKEHQLPPAEGQGQAEAV